MKVREVLAKLNKEGWEINRTRGSHRNLVHPDKPGVAITVSGNLHDDMDKGLLSSILKKAGLK